MPGFASWADRVHNSGAVSVTGQSQDKRGSVATESESGPMRKPLFGPKDVPAGWMWVPEDPSAPVVSPGSFRPDPRHPNHPYALAQRQQPKLRAWLDADDELQAFIHHWKPRAHRVLTTLRARIVAGPNDPNTTQEAAQFADTLLDAILVACHQLGPDDVLPWIKQHYLTESVIPPEFLARYMTRVEPVGLFATTDGRIVMAFTGATSTERTGYDTLIRAAQERFGHRKDQGGRKSRKKDPGKTDDVKTAAKLHHWLGWPHPSIAAFLGWSGKRESVDERVRRAIRDGEELLRNELGPDWHVEPPPALADKD